MVSGSLALLYFLPGFHEGRQGSPVEWGLAEAWLVGWSSDLVGWSSGIAEPQAWLAGP